MYYSLESTLLVNNLHYCYKFNNPKHVPYKEMARYVATKILYVFTLFFVQLHRTVKPAIVNKTITDLGNY